MTVLTSRVAHAREKEVPGVCRAWHDSCSVVYAGAHVGALGAMRRAVARHGAAPCGEVSLVRRPHGGTCTRRPAARQTGRGCPGAGDRNAQQHADTEVAQRCWASAHSAGACASVGAVLRRIASLALVRIGVGMARQTRGCVPRPDPGRRRDHGSITQLSTTTTDDACRRPHIAS